MYEYTIQAFNSDQSVGKINVINVVVQANSEAEAIERAKQIVERHDYTVVSIKELDRKFKKG